MKLSCQLDPIHWGGEHERLLGGWQPKSIRIINPDRGRIERIMGVCPDSLYVLREHGPSEDHGRLLGNPVDLGREHALMWVRKLNEWNLGLNLEQFVFLGLNEPHVWEDGVPAAITQYTLSFLRELSRHGLRGGAFSFSVGWPANTGKDTPVDWWPYEPVHEYMRENPKHFLCIHEYWCKEGPRVTADGGVDREGGPWGWTAGRYLQCPWNVPIIVGECGLEQVVCQSGLDYWQRGWKAYYGDRPGVYAQQLFAYEEQIAKDSRIHSAQIYLLDGNTHHWGSLYYHEQIPMFGRNPDLSWHVDLGDGPVEPKPPPGDDLAAHVEALGRDNQLVRVYPDAALVRKLRELGRYPVSNEFEFEWEGRQYVGQRGEDLSNNALGVTVYVERGDWGNVKVVMDGS